jgi:glucose-1-phosphate cytidylyltransferase
MKVVIFCGGQGLRLRDFSESLPKPMVPVGYRPIIWHTMKYYAHYGHKEFILALGWKADVIKDYFLNYNETVSNDFVLSGGGRDVRLLNRDIDDWKITFVDTVGDDEYFMFNYSDCLTDAPLDQMIDNVKKNKAHAGCISVKPSTSFHVIQYGMDSKVSGFRLAQDLDIWINGGYWIAHRDYWNYIREGEELTNEPMQRLIEADRLVTYRYNGFWGCMDTFKEKMLLDDLVAKGKAPWQVWQKNRLPVK